ncbi:hypothetical protein ACS0TY_008466 [Phlomoides rotata]
MNNFVKITGISDFLLQRVDIYFALFLSSTIGQKDRVDHISSPLLKRRKSRRYGRSTVRQRERGRSDNSLRKKHGFLEITKRFSKSMPWSDEDTHRGSAKAKLGELYPMSRAYLTTGDPLYNKLKELFAPGDDIDDDDLIIVIDGEDKEYPLFEEPVVHALPAAAYYPLDEDIVVISSDEDDEFVDGLFDSNIDLGFSSDDELPQALVTPDEAVSGLSNVDPINLNAPPTEEEVMSPVIHVPIISASAAAIQASLRSIPRFTLRDESISSYETD